MELVYFNQLPFDILRSHLLPKLSPVQIIDILSFPHLFGLAPVLMQETILSELRRQVCRECLLELKDDGRLPKELQIKEQIEKIGASTTLLTGKTLPRLPWAITRYLYLFFNLRNYPSPSGSAIYYKNKIYLNAVPFDFIEILRALRIIQWDQFSELIPDRVPWISLSQYPKDIGCNPRSYNLPGFMEDIGYRWDLHNCVCLAKSTDCQIEEFPIADITLKIINHHLIQRIITLFYDKTGLRSYEDVVLSTVFQLLDEVNMAANSLLEFCLISAIKIFIDSEELDKLLVYLHDHYSQQLAKLINRRYSEHSEHYLLIIACESRNVAVVRILLELGADLEIDNNCVLPSLFIGHEAYDYPGDEGVAEILQLLLDAGIRLELAREALDKCNFIDYCSQLTPESAFDTYPEIVKQVILSIYPDFPIHLRQL